MAGPRSGRRSRETDPNQARVKGGLDLVNLFPVLVDVSVFRQAWGDSATFRLYDRSGRLRHCRLSDVSPDEAGSIQVSAVETDAHEPLESAALHAFDLDGVDVGDWLDGNGRAMLAVMAGDQLRADPVFNPYPASMTNSVIPMLVRAEHLTKGIPALTPATGRMAIPGPVMGNGKNSPAQS